MNREAQRKYTLASLKILLSLHFDAVGFELQFNMTTVLIVGLDSDLAMPVVRFARNMNWRLIGTSRRSEPVVSDCDKVYHLDVSSIDSIKTCAQEIVEVELEDRMLIVLSVGTLEPIGLAGDVGIQDWNYALGVNGVGPLNLIQKFLELRKDNVDVFLTYAGNGTNSAPTHFSSYTLAKIMLIKAMEVLAAEYPHKAFVSLGTGWMNTKIHNVVQKSSAAPHGVVRETNIRMASGKFGDPDLISFFLEKIFSLDYSVFSGRNFSLQGDAWQDDHFWQKIERDHDNNKLRRIHN